MDPIYSAAHNLMKVPLASGISGVISNSHRGERLCVCVSEGGGGAQCYVSNAIGQHRVVMLTPREPEKPYVKQLALPKQAVIGLLGGKTR